MTPNASAPREPHSQPQDPASNCAGRVLFVCAPLFSYHESIMAEIKTLGFDVTWWNDRVSDSSLHKIALRLMPRLLTAWSTARFQERLDQLDTRSIARVFVVKGEGMSVEFVETLKRSLPGVPFSLYFWDSVSNARRGRSLAPLFDRVATFDPVDAANFGWTYRPLFARSLHIGDNDGARVRQYDWSFIGTLHSDRLRVADRLRQSNPSLNTYFFGYVPSRLVLILRYLIDWRLWKLPRGSVSTRSKTAKEVTAISRDSRAVLDVEHPRQRGLTMRTIETILSGQKLMTTNRHVVATDLFDASRVHVISRDAPQVPLAFLDIPFEPVAEAVRRRYRLRQWVLDLIGEPVSTVRTTFEVSAPAPQH